MKKKFQYQKDYGVTKISKSKISEIFKNFRIFKFNLVWRTQFPTKKLKITYKTSQLY